MNSPNLTKLQGYALVLTADFDWLAFPVRRGYQSL